MSKQKYIAVLSDGVLERALIKAIEDQGYKLMRINNYGTHKTHLFNNTDNDDCIKPILNGEKENLIERY